MELLMVSRHTPTPAQIETARSMGFTGIRQVDLNVQDPAFEQLLSEHTQQAGAVPLPDLPRDLQNRPQVWMRKALSVVAPFPVLLRLAAEGWHLIHWENTPSARHKGVFLCSGARHLHVSVNPEGHLEHLETWHPCPISLEHQEESSLTPTQRG